MRSGGEAANLIHVIIASARALALGQARNRIALKIRKPRAEALGYDLKPLPTSPVSSFSYFGQVAAHSDRHQARCIPALCASIFTTLHPITWAAA